MENNRRFLPASGAPQPGGLPPPPDPLPSLEEFPPTKGPPPPPGPLFVFTLLLE